MSNELVRKSLEGTMTVGGLKDLVKMTETVMLLIDTSGSMNEGITSNYGAPRCIDKLRESVNAIQSSANEPIPMIAFGGPYDAMVRFVDVVPEPDGGTPLHMAIPLAKEYGANRVVVISDGIPDLREQSLEEARNFGGRIDVVYVGKDKGGLTFLKALAACTGGQILQGDLRDVKALTSHVIGLLDGEVAPATGRVFATDADGSAVATEVEIKDEENDDDVPDDEN